MSVIFVIGLVLIGCFGFVLLFGAPYLPTLQPQVQAALDLLDLSPGQTLLELGCGDGRVLLAASRHGLYAVGYELNPILASIAYIRTIPYRRSIKVIWGNYWQIKWPDADGMFVFILPKYMGKLHKKVVQYKHKPIRVASFAFAIPSQAPIKQKNGVYLYIYK